MDLAREIAWDDAGRADYGVYVSYYHRQCNVTSASSHVRDLRSGPNEPTASYNAPIRIARSMHETLQLAHVPRMHVGVTNPFLVGINPDRGPTIRHWTDRQAWSRAPRRMRSPYNKHVSYIVENILGIEF